MRRIFLRVSNADRTHTETSCYQYGTVLPEPCRFQSVDRLGRSLQDLVTFLGELHAKRVDIYLHQQGIDTSTPAGKAMFQMMGVFAEFERAMIVERVKAGLARARAQGRRLGRPSLAADKERVVRRLLSKGTAIVKTARTAGVGVSAVQRIKAAVAGA